MESAGYILITANIVAGFVGAIPLARFFNRVHEKPKKNFHYFKILIGVYGAECIAIVLGMGIPVMNVGLAFLWGIIFGLWLRKSISKHTILKTSFYLSLYTSLPVMSFITVPAMAMLSGWHILDSKQGLRFGIPDFLLWPLNTILGFYIAVIVIGVVLKTIITTTEMRSLFFSWQKTSSNLEQDN